jgi:hypothetical protein
MTNAASESLLLGGSGLQKAARPLSRVRPYLQSCRKSTVLAQCLPA